MKIKRFHGKTMHEAIRRVREEQGPDAVILSNRRVAGGVEVVAAVDYDAALMQQTLRVRETAPEEEPAAPPPPVKSGNPRIEAALSSTLSALDVFSSKRAKPAPAPDPVVALAPAVVVAAPKTVAAPVMAKPVPTIASLSVPNADLAQMRKELSSMRTFFEEQFAGIAWNDMQRMRPGQAAAVRLLADLGIEPGLAKTIAEELPDSTDEARARYLPLGFLSRRLLVDASDPVMNGGIFALLGPTGAGKTTTIAKLAGRFAAKYGARDIALVTTDHFRIGATEQLYNYGRLLGVPVHALGPRDDLSVTLQRLADRRLVLVDTAGLGTRDALLAVQIERLRAAGPSLKSYLVLAANVDIASQKEIVRAFSKLPLAGCIVTKIDEADRVGAALSIGLRNKLAFTYFTDGQRVPEDIHVAAADKLVLRATQLARGSSEPLDEHALARGLTHTVSHAHV